MKSSKRRTFLPSLVLPLLLISSPGHAILNQVGDEILNCDDVITSHSELEKIHVASLTLDADFKFRGGVFSIYLTGPVQTVIFYKGITERISGELFRVRIREQFLKEFEEREENTPIKLEYLIRLLDNSTEPSTPKVKEIILDGNVICDLNQPATKRMIEEEDEDEDDVIDIDKKMPRTIISDAPKSVLNKRRQKVSSVLEKMERIVKEKAVEKKKPSLQRALPDDDDEK